MNEESKQMLNDSLLMKASIDSYLKKEELIQMLENLKFSEVKDVNITCITGYQIKESSSTKEKYVQTLGYDIRID